jgi:hypothetical protein
MLRKGEILLGIAIAIYGFFCIVAGIKISGLSDHLTL